MAVVSVDVCVRDLAFSSKFLSLTWLREIKTYNKSNEKLCIYQRKCRTNWVLLLLLLLVVSLSLLWIAWRCILFFYLNSLLNFRVCFSDVLTIVDSRRNKKIYVKERSLAFPTEIMNNIFVECILFSVSKKIKTFVLVLFFCFSCGDYFIVMRSVDAPHTLSDFRFYYRLSRWIWTAWITYALRLYYFSIVRNMRYVCDFIFYNIRTRRKKWVDTNDILEW